MFMNDSPLRNPVLSGCISLYGAGSIVIITTASVLWPRHILEIAKIAMSVNKQLAERRIVDASGTWWRVTEVRIWDASGHGATSLIAAHERGFRRLWDFPADWVELGDGQLAELVSKPVRKMRKQASS
jgi:hypothetical protein